MSTSRSSIVGTSIAGLILVICIAVAVNVILSRVPARVDLTGEKLYRLSDGTRAVLRDLPDPVTLKFYFTGSDAAVPAFLKNFARDVEDLLTEYQIAGRGKIVVRKFDPKPDSDDEEWAQRYGLSGQSLGFGGPTVYLGLVAIRGDAETAIPFIDPRSQNLMEYNITRMITRVANPKKPVIGVLSSLPVMGRQAMPFMGQNRGQPPWIVFGELRQDYDVREVNPGGEMIDPDIDVLVVVHPKQLADTTLFAIDQFVMRGGRLIAFVDPLCLTEGEVQMFPQQQNQFGPKSSNMEKLFDAWGVKFQTDKVVADLAAATPIPVGGNRVEESPIALSLRRAHFNKESTLTSGLDLMAMPYAGAFTIAPIKGIRVVPLVTSSEQSGLVDAMMAQFTMESAKRSFKSGMKRMDLAVQLQGRFKTAFPDGRPVPTTPNDADKKDAPQPAAGSGLKESVKETTVVLVGDVDMLYDPVCVQQFNMFGTTQYQPKNDNLALFGNLVEQAAGNPALIGIRSRGRTQRPFEVVLQLRRNAEEKYLAEEQTLQNKLETAEKRLAELQSQKDEKQRFILSPQQRREIENFQKEVARTKGELKLVRRKLAQDIENLGLKVKVVNILLMPLMLAAVGIGYGAYRRSRSRS